MVVRELGYPSVKQLGRWVRIYEKTGYLPRDLKRRERYSRAQKIAAVEHYLTNGGCLSFTRRAIGYPSNEVLKCWIQEFYPNARPRRRRYSSYCGEISPAPENLVDRDFSACRPNEKWLTDITEFHLPAGKVYLSPVIDCFDGQVVSWAIGTRPDATLVNTMLDDALDTLRGEMR